jgi:hypothetical protein
MRDDLTHLKKFLNDSRKKRISDDITAATIVLFGTLTALGTIYIVMVLVVGG